MKRKCEVNRLEKELIEKIKNGNREAFSTLYDSYADYALRSAFMITKNKEIASDAVQETFIRAYNKIHTFQTEKPFKPWFYRILLNECNRLLAKEKKIIPFDEIESRLPSSVREEEDCDSDYLFNAINELDEINRTPIVLKYIHEFSEKEIAETLDVNVNTVKSRLFKGRQKLKSALTSIFKGGSFYE